MATSYITAPGPRSIMHTVPANGSTTLNMPNNNQFFAVSCGVDSASKGYLWAISINSTGSVNVAKITGGDSLTYSTGVNSLTFSNSGSYAASILFLSFYGNLPTV